MKTEILKFMVESAADFELSKVEPNSYNIRYMFKNRVIGLEKIETIESSPYYPLLLTRACEGLRLAIFQSEKDVWIYSGTDELNVNRITYDTPDKAKEAAITAVMKEMIG